MTAETPAPETEALPPVPPPPGPEAPPTPPPAWNAPARPLLARLEVHADDRPMLLAMIPSATAGQAGEAFGWDLAMDDGPLPEGMDAAIVRGMLEGALARLSAPWHHDGIDL